MKGVRVLTLCALLVGILSSPAAAQFGPFGPGGLILSSQSVGQAQVTTPTGSAQNLLSQAIGTGAFSNPVAFHGRGFIDGQPSSPGTLTLTVALGTATAQTVVDAVTIETGVTTTPSIPFWLDCEWTPTNTGTTAVTLQTSLQQYCRLTWMPETGTAAKVFAPTTLAAPTITISLTTTQTLLIKVTFSDTAFGTGITMTDWRLVQGY